MSYFQAKQNNTTISNRVLEKRKNLHILTFNMRVEFNRDEGYPNETWEQRLPGIIDAFKKYNADIIGTQELRTWQLDELMESIESKYKAFGEPRYSPDDEHCVIIYNGNRFNLIEGKTFWLSETSNIIGSKSWDSAFPRIVTYGKFIDRVNNKTFVFINTHLDHESSLARRNGLKMIVDLMLENNDYPIILTGDFNMHLESDDFDALNNQKNHFGHTYAPFQDQFIPNGKTYHGYQGGKEGKPIDFIYYSLSKLLVTKTSIIYDKWNDQIYLSDHYPVFSALNYIKDSV